MRRGKEGPRRASAAAIGAITRLYFAANEKAGVQRVLRSLTFGPTVLHGTQSSKKCLATVARSPSAAYSYDSRAGIGISGLDARLGVYIFVTLGRAAFKTDRKAQGYLMPPTRWEQHTCTRYTWRSSTIESPRTMLGWSSSLRNSSSRRTFRSRSQVRRVDQSLLHPLTQPVGPFV